VGLSQGDFNYPILKKYNFAAQNDKTVLSLFENATSIETPTWVHIAFYSLKDIFLVSLFTITCCAELCLLGNFMKIDKPLNIFQIKNLELALAVARKCIAVTCLCLFLFL